MLRFFLSGVLFVKNSLYFKLSPCEMGVLMIFDNGPPEAPSHDGLDEIGVVA